jgi:competence protein ComQ
MDQQIETELLGIIDRHIETDDLNRLLKSFIAEKRNEGSIWSKLTLNVHFMLGGQSPHILRHAALTELAILALDIVDDLQDRDNPDKPWMSSSVEFTLNGVLALLMACVGEAQPDAVKEIARFIIRSVNGQQRDLNHTVRNEQDYFEMTALKSGSLIRLACYMGYSIVEGITEDQSTRLDELAGLIGVIAQLGNDIKDITLLSTKNDLLSKKRTLPALYLLQDAESEFPPLHEYYEGALSAEQFLKHKSECLNYIRSSGCLEYSNVLQALYIEQAEAIFNQLELQSPWREAFRDLAFAPREEQNADN